MPPNLGRSVRTAFAFALVRYPGAAPSRSISLTGAIEKGIRDTHHGARRYDPSGSNSDKDARPGTFHPQKTSGLKQGDETPDRRRRTARDLERRGSASTADDHVPSTIPYTTASSEFLYGTFAVLAALQAKRRKLYTLYHLSTSEADVERDDEAGRKAGTRTARHDESLRQRKVAKSSEAQREIYRLTQAAGVDIRRVGGPRWAHLLTRASQGRPHNGLLLETSPLPRLPVTSLGRLHRSSDPVLVDVGWASPEEREINGVFERREKQALIPSPRPAHRYPFMLFLDRITDTGNIGAIVRSAWFLGVDAIIMLEHGTAPLSNTTVKASAGALEYLPLLQTKDERGFVTSSRQNGWRFFAADIATHDEARRRKPGRDPCRDRPVDATGVLLQHPCVLVVGNEETGIRDHLKSLMDGVISIPPARRGVGDVDSLNVSVAAALLTQKFLESASEPSTAAANDDVAS